MVEINLQTRTNNGLSHMPDKSPYRISDFLPEPAFVCWFGLSNTVGFFELQVYTARPGKRDALTARFEGRTAGGIIRPGSRFTLQFWNHYRNPAGIRDRK